MKSLHNFSTLGNDYFYMGKSRFRKKIIYLMRQSNDEYNQIFSGEIENSQRGKGADMDVFSF